MKEWFFTEQAILEAAINKLKCSLENAYIHSRSFVSATHQAVAQFQQVNINVGNTNA